MKSIFQVRPSAYDFNYLIDNLIHLFLLDAAYPVQDDVHICGKKSVGPYVTRLSELTGLEISTVNRNGVNVFDIPACDLAQDSVVSLQRCENKGWSPF